ncbi:telomere-associated protein RIF1-like [Impatiens glandulifera]|uniref:telomere-associated protein RIF1-like n=1 Tax=Impatiens glandulifera TaxID=253017 RepID=UPI001FB06E4D|nr:telomere-associated protein RIF1-like [Impatiens glandulifera]
MANFSMKLEELKSHLSSNSKSNKSFAYSTFSNLQEESCSGADPSCIKLISDSAPDFLPYILSDITDLDEEIAVQALKCLGFMIYHPSLVSSFTGNDASLILTSLAKVILATKIKSVCNLGMWCLSVQQLHSLHLAANFPSLLKAIIHALNNPMSSLSTTFEAMQAVVKLASQVQEEMRHASSIWAPQVYGGIISPDKRLRDMSERCLLKIKSTIYPPPLTLSKALLLDLKKKLLPGMKSLLELGLKTQAIQAWGWYIRLLGPYVVKNRHLVNEMLKVPEKTFSDVDPRVQIASMVAWEGLIDALFLARPSLRTSTDTTSELEIQDGVEDGYPKSIKLIMTPLKGILSSKLDLSVHSSCINTWCYLLHKLDKYVNYPSVRKTVLEPIIEAIFSVGPDSNIILLWDGCLDLLDDYILMGSEHVENHLSKQFEKTSSPEAPSTCPSLLKHYPIKWSPWDLRDLGFCIKMVHLLISQSSVVTASEKVKKLALDSSLRLFRTILKGAQNVLKNPLTNYDDVMLFLTSLLGFVKKIFQDSKQEMGEYNDSYSILLQIVEAIIEELEPSILGSPIYKLALDVDNISNSESINETKLSQVVHFRLFSCTTYMNKVSPIGYLTTFYFCGVFRSSFKYMKEESNLQKVSKYFKFLLLSFGPSEILQVVTGLINSHMGFSYLKAWTAIANGLKDFIDETKNSSLLKQHSDLPGYTGILHVLAYPFAVCSLLEELNTQKSTECKFEFEQVVNAWKLLYISANCASLVESSILNGFADDLVSILRNMTECISDLDLCDENLNFHVLSLYGNTVASILEHIKLSASSSERSKNKDGGERERSSNINNILEFSARSMSLLYMKEDKASFAGLDVTIRVFCALTHFVSSLYLKEDILSFIKVSYDPLIEWLSWSETTQNVSIISNLQLLWTETLNCLQRSHPPIVFNSTFLEKQAALLEQTLDHSNPSISCPTIKFWNSTYGEHMELDYPPSLLPVLDKLSRSRKIKLCKNTQTKCQESTTTDTRLLYMVNATQKISSKRVEFVDKEFSLGKRKRLLELTEHQKEVRRAQQGRTRDSSGHGPGIRTYTSADFSQGDETSQDFRL